MPYLAIFTGNAHPELAKNVTNHLHIPLGRADVTRFSDGEVAVEIQENVRGKDVFILQSTCSPTNLSGDVDTDTPGTDTLLHRNSIRRRSPVIGSLTKDLGGDTST
jgi:hypothetical protein